jgi:methionyl-tRNA formyltransferase
MRKVFFLVNSMAEFDFADALAELLPGVEARAGDAFPTDPGAYDLIVLWSVRKLLPQASGKDNVIVFHSSDLPLGKGWAPVYNAIARGQERFTITGILPVAEADAGDIVVKASFRLRPEYTAASLRAFDHRLCLLMIGGLLRRFPDGRLRGGRQSGPGSWYPKRKPEDNAVDPARPLLELMPHLRACEPRHPAFFEYQGVKYLVQVTPEVPPAFPDDVEYEFYDPA